MKTIIKTKSNGEPTGYIVFVSSVDGKELALYNPERQSRREVVKEHLSINADRLTLEFKKPYIERAKSQYKKEIAELLKKYEGITITEHSYV